MRPEYIRLVWLQGVITILGASFAYLVDNPPAAKSFLYGCSVALVSTLFLALRLKQGEKQENQVAEWALRQAYRTAIERFVWTAIMLAVGFGILRLAPIWMLAGFVVGQAAWLLIPIWMKLRTHNDN
jgi:F0F1-type ATP synthase assembly protein I